MKLYPLCYADKIHTRKNFKLILEKSQKFSSPNLTIFVYHNPDNILKSRIGLIISQKKIRFTSHVRKNRLKRRLREIFRLNRHKFLKPADIIIMPHSNDAVLLNYKKLESEFLEVIKKAGLLME